MRNQGIILTIAVSLLVIAIVCIYVTQVYIPSEREKVSKNYEQRYQTKGVYIVKRADGLSKGDKIREEHFTEGTIAVESIPIEFIPVDDSGIPLVFTVEDTADEASQRSVLIDQVLKEDVTQGSMITLKNLGQQEAGEINHYEREIEIEVENAVGDSLRTGKYVDIIVKYLTGEYDVVISKKKVEKLATPVTTQTDEAGNTTTSTQDTSTVKILIAVNEKQYRDIELARRLGKLSVRTYKDAAQYASLETFNYYSNMTGVNNILKQMDEGEKYGEHSKYYEEASLIYEINKDIVSSTEEVNAFSQAYSDIYYEIEPLIKDKVVLLKKDTTYTGKSETITVDELVEATDYTNIDVVIGLIFGNITIQANGLNRQEVYTKLANEKFETSTKIRRSVADVMVSTTLNTYFENSGKVFDTEAYKYRYLRTY